LSCFVFHLLNLLLTQNFVHPTLFSSQKHFMTSWGERAKHKVFGNTSTVRQFQRTIFLHLSMILLRTALPFNLEEGGGSQKTFSGHTKIFPDMS
jgi:hypothetical protein